MPEVKTLAKQVAVALAASTVVALAFALQQQRTIWMFQDRRVDLWTVLWPSLTTNWPHGLLAPAVIAWSQWMERRRAQVVRFVLAHSAGYVAYVGLHALLRFALFPAHHPRTGALYPRNYALLKNLFVLYSADDFFMYAPVVGATMAWVAYRRNRSRELALAGAELQILKMQLQPHFLFNTLQAISTLVGKDAAAAKRTIALLGDLLRAVTDRAGEQEVPLSEELDLLDRYVQIELVRFGDRLSVDLDVAPSAMECLVPSLLLQPIVENAVRHGTRVRVAGAARGGRLRLAVSDNGPGMAAERRPGGLGLENTRARLKGLYGPDHSLEFRNDGGLVVTIDIPERRR
jgi:two-component system LytT family sensor kinase